MQSISVAHLLDQLAIKFSIKMKSRLLILQRQVAMTENASIQATNDL